MNKLSKRSCGTCIACCVYLKIPELGKNPLTPCLFLTVGGNKYTGSCSKNCIKYETRPLACKEYACTWVLGIGTEEDRPDKSGILIDRANEVENALEAKPIIENAQKTQKGRATILRASNNLNCPVIVFGWLEKEIETIVGRGVIWP